LIASDQSKPDVIAVARIDQPWTQRPGGNSAASTSGAPLSIDWLAELLEDFPLVVGVLFGGLPCLVGARRLVF